MKKTISFTLTLITLLFLTACDKTDVEESLNEARMEEDTLTKEDYEALNKDPEFKENYLDAMVEATKEARINEDYNLAVELDESEDAKKAGKSGKGSCDAIADSSTCIEYYGSYWGEVEMKLNCEGAGTFSTKPCPADTSGGCNTGMGTSADMVAWMYLRGGGEITADSLKYAKMACDSTMASKWVTR